MVKTSVFIMCFQKNFFGTTKFGGEQKI